VIRLVGAVLAEQHDEWVEQRRYLGLESCSSSAEPLSSLAPNQKEEPSLILGAISA